VDQWESHIHGNPIYDKLQRVISPNVTWQSNRCRKEALGLTIAGSSEKHKQRHSVDVGELRGFLPAFQDDIYNREMKQKNVTRQTRSGHRFSVDLGEVSKLIALTEMRVCYR